MTDDFVSCICADCQDDYGCEGCPACEEDADAED